ncbi:hypothetical protein [uncultured Algoriphagus sp.]|uniref:hypothetical protein n=1 Tax=uncultured Algoriphagus sp. TaxID=417365 RepID=UPI002597CDA1|nr:hypothetical protein [uncultured Algoriphagus sp.]
MKKVLTFILTWGIIQFAFAQNDPLTQTHGARMVALGKMRVHLPDTWSYFNNIGALDRTSYTGIVVGYDHRYNLKELSTFSLAGSFRNTWGTFGAGISRFGGPLLNQQTLGVGYSNTLGISSFGIKLEWAQTQIEGFGSAGGLVVSIGGVTELSPSLFLGAHISNINRGKISPESESRLPTSVQLGLHYVPSESLSLLLEFEKDILQDPIVKAGIEYRMKEWVILRTGVNSQPAKIFAGFGIQKESYGFDYSYGNQSALGNTHHLSLFYRWND